MSKIDIQEELTSLWEQARWDYHKGGDYELHAVRMDHDAFHLLRQTVPPNGPDLYLGSDPYKWRGLPIVMEAGGMTDLERYHATPRRLTDTVDYKVQIICIETRQPGQYGRSKYYDWKRT